MSKNGTITGTITVSTDGSALGNPDGPMGWAWAEHDSERTDCGGAANGTNQIGELCAVLQALRTHRGSCELVIESDSQYAIKCASEWIRNWKRNGWKNSKKEPVKNMQVIKAIDEEISNREGPVRFEWVKGHAGNRYNEKCDELARTYAQDVRSGKKTALLPKEGWDTLLHSDYAGRDDIPQAVAKMLEGKDADYSAYVPKDGSDSVFAGVSRNVSKNAVDVSRETSTETAANNAANNVTNTASNAGTDAVSGRAETASLSANQISYLIRQLREATVRFERAAKLFDRAAQRLSDTLNDTEDAQNTLF